jgi:uncharacterized protein with von Willebrand factor type A (vWA) domain
VTGDPHGGPGSILDDPNAWITALAAALRDEGLESSLSEAILARNAAGLLDLSDRLDVHHGLRAAFCSREADLPVFDACFERLWRGAPRLPDTPLPRPGRHGVTPDVPLGSAGRPVRAEAGDEGRGPAIGGAYSAAEHLARRSFSAVSDNELKDLDRWIEGLLIRLSTRRSRRLEPGGRRGPVDLRRSAAHAVRTEGEWLRLLRRRRKREPPKVVVLCDVSGSMERYSRFLVQFMLATGRATDIETFAFSTRLTHLTPWLGRTRVDEALEELRARGWSSGTRIGECLADFVERHGRAMLGRRTLVVILSDGLDQGEIEPLERAMQRIQRRARRVVWLNPLLENSRYAPEARGMRAALPYIDDFESGHSLEALRKLPEILRL